MLDIISNYSKHTGFLVLIEMIMKSIIFWGVTLCMGLIEVSKECTASIFRVKEQVKIATSKKQAAGTVSCTWVTLTGSPLQANI